MKQARLTLWLLALAVGISAFAYGDDEITLTMNIVYGRAGEVELRLNLAQPATRDGLLPALVFIHGGGWQLGNKNDYNDLIRRFASYGYVTATVGYRLAPAHPWPAQIEDVKCAVRYLRAHADEYGIEADKIGAVGHSAGGHLALLLGLVGAEHGLEGDGGHAGESSAIQAVVNLCGPSDLRTWAASPEAHAEAKAATGKDFEDVLKDFVGTTDRSEPVIAQASPVTYVTPNAPPVLTFHGDMDIVVPVEQARILHDALDKAGVKHHQCNILEGGDHGFMDLLHLARILEEGRQFADKHLKGIE